jgi:predicted outer membrane repeat protein
MVTLTAVTVTGGQGNGGGALNSAADVDVQRSVLTGNRSSGEGGAIQTQGDATVNLNQSAVTNNTAVGSGGAIAAQGAVTVTQSTLADNTSGNNGGAIRAYGGAVLTNSTLSGNLASGDGGAIDTNHSLTLTYATVVSNSSTNGANLSMGDNQLLSFGSVVALPVSGTNCIDVSSTTSTGYNFDDDGTCGFGAGPGDRSDFAGALQLAPLAANDGLGQTRLPAATSPLVDHIPLSSCGAGLGITSDERNVSRPQGLGCDVGAVELAASTPTSSTTAPTATSSTQGPASPVQAAPQFTG